MTTSADPIATRAPPAVAGALAIVIGAIAAKYFGGRLVPVGLLAIGGLCFVVCWAARAELTRSIALLLGAVAAVTAVVDIGFRVMLLPHESFHGVTDRGWGESYGSPSTEERKYRAIAVRNDNGHTIYDVVYTTDHNGYRQTGTTHNSAETVLFFGDSFTYGMGVADHETMPSRFAAAIGEKFRVINVAFPAFGPHTMLRVIETNAYAGAVAGSKVRRCYFLAIDDHMRRSVGLEHWQKPSPRYVLGDDGRPVFAGLYQDHWFWRLIGADGLLRRVGEFLGKRAYPRQYQVRVAAATIARSAEILKERHDTELVTILWDRFDVDDLERALSERGLPTIRISTLVPDIEDPALRILAGIENHPSAALLEVVGRALARREQ